MSAMHLEIQPSSSLGRTNRNPDVPVEILAQKLDELSRLISQLRDDEYLAIPRRGGASPIGSHVRHALDHVTALLRAVPRGLVNYDLRERGTEIEGSRQAALRLIEGQQIVLRGLVHVDSQQSLTVEAMLDPNQAPLTMLSSWGREVAFVLSHTIHHQALIGVLASWLGVWVDPEFGVAPATLASQVSSS